MLIKREREMRNWGEMLAEMLPEICKRVKNLKDLAAFGGVCSTWRHVAVEQNLGQPLLPLPWLMLAENQNDDVREFYSVTEDKTYNIELPELRGKKCMETKGWIVTASETGEMALVQPLTRVTIPLPHQNTSEVYNEQWMDPLFFVKRAVLSSPPNSEDDRDCVLVILHGVMGHIGFCRPGDKVWTVIEKNFEGASQSVEYHRGKFYVVINEGDVWEYDVVGKSIDTVSSRRIYVNFCPLLLYNQAYLVDSAGSLLVVIRGGIELDDDDRNYDPAEFWVIKIDVEQGGYEEVSGLGTRSIFLGYNGTLFVDTIWYPELIPNSIYFTDDCYESYRRMPEGGGMSMGVYNLSDKNVQPHYSGKLLSFICPPVWTFLTTR